MAHARADNRYTRGLAEFVSGLRYERIPEEVRARLELLILDSFGCALMRLARRNSPPVVSKTRFQHEDTPSA
jgi:2-methylcitrate dehydratase PrpD